MNFILLTPAENEAVLAHNDGTIFLVRPRRIDRADSEHVGLFAAPARVATGDGADHWAGFLAPYPRLTGDPDALFETAEV